MKLLDVQNQSFFDLIGMDKKAIAKAMSDQPFDEEELMFALVNFYLEEFDQYLQTLSDRYNERLDEINEQILGGQFLSDLSAFKKAIESAKADPCDFDEAEFYQHVKHPDDVFDHLMQLTVVKKEIEEQLNLVTHLQETLKKAKSKKNSYKGKS